MPLVKAQCTNCGGNLEVDGSKDAVVCPFCNTPFVVEKAVNQYKTTNSTTNNIVANGAQINVSQGLLDADTMFENWLARPTTALVNDFNHYYTTDPRNEFVNVVNTLGYENGFCKGWMYDNNAKWDEYKEHITSAKKYAEEFLAGPRFEQYADNMEVIKQAEKNFKDHEEDVKKQEEARQKAMEEAAIKQREQEEAEKKVRGCCIFILAIPIVILIIEFLFFR